MVCTRRTISQWFIFFEIKTEIKINVIWTFWLTETEIIWQTERKKNLSSNFGTWLVTWNLALWLETWLATWTLWLATWLETWTLWLATWLETWALWLETCLRLGLSDLVAALLLGLNSFSIVKCWHLFFVWTMEVLYLVDMSAIQFKDVSCFGDAVE